MEKYVLTRKELKVATTFILSPMRRVKSYLLASQNGIMWLAPFTVTSILDGWI